ncbi:hypothetical protein mRhiFer1_009421 [Rhinolophus ferrumequinum]|uniref:Uncharacterized protein n=1 Tax=Rhinolophus ferrumequinum TaxID=59479 RepID=A0A7J7RJB4_RHIFE|nr:hypothetical protein mRhiFer1_009421 [Rhinolophus ferrumequinum]
MLLFNIFLEWLLDILKNVLSFFHGNGFLIKNYELSIILSDVLTFEAVIQDSTEKSDCYVEVSAKFVVLQDSCHNIKVAGKSIQQIVQAVQQRVKEIGVTKQSYVTDDYIIGWYKSAALTYSGSLEFMKTEVPTSSAVAGEAT